MSEAPVVRGGRFAADYQAMVSAAQIAERIDAMIAEGKPFGFDIESSYTGQYIEKKQLHTYHPEWKFVGFSFTNSFSWARYVPIGHIMGGNVDDPVLAARAMWRLLQTGLGVAHNLSFEFNALSRWFRDLLWNDPVVGEQVRAAQGWYPARSDSMIEAHLLAEYPPKGVIPIGRNGNVGVGLKELTLEIFGHQMIEFDSLFVTASGKKAGPKDRKFDHLPVTQKHIDYACEDALWCLALHLRHHDQVKDSFIYKTEMALMPWLVRMEAEGLALDWAEVERKAEEVAAFRDGMVEEIHQDFEERLGRPVVVNLASPMQLKKILFDPKPEGLGLTPTHFTDKDEPSTDEKALRVAAKSDPLLSRILQYREVAKLYGSYLNKYRTQLNYDPSGRAHPKHNQVGALTGRMSVDHVSYQQWPKPYHYELRDGTTFDLNFRNLLIAPEGYRIVGYDYSQVELRVLAGLANETAMLKAFNTGVDIHKATAAAMMKIPLEQVTKKQRAVGKTLNFAVVYGSGAANIAEMLTTPDAPVTTDEAREMLARYYAGFPNLKAWMAARVAEGRESHMVFTPFGRKFTVWEYSSPHDYIRSKGDRMCVNAPVQGGAADYMKAAMVRASKRIADTGMSDKVRLVMTVHDALEFYVRDDVPTQEVIDLLNPAVSFRVPQVMPNAPEIRADWHEGRRWGSVVEVKLDDDKQIVGWQVEDTDTVWSTWEQANAFLGGEPVAPQNVHPEPTAPQTIEQVERVFASITTGAIEVPEVVATVRITLPEVPSADQWNVRFKALRDEHPGKSTVLIDSPLGTSTLSTTHSFTMRHAGNIAAIFPGATMFIEDASLVDGIDL